MPEPHQQGRSGAFIINFQHVSAISPVFLLYPLNIKLFVGKPYIKIESYCRMA